MGNLFKHLVFATLFGATAFAQLPDSPGDMGRKSRNLAGESMAPDIDFSMPKTGSSVRLDQADVFKERETEFNRQLQMQALGAPIDAEQYYVGPGDQFLVSVWASLEESLPAQISPEGKLIIPTVGAIDVRGKSLAEAQEIARREVSGKYVNSKISIDLVLVRGIRVHVTGQVRNPGPYSVLAVYRVADALQLAGGLTSWAFERGIQVRHADSTIDHVDLHAYKNLGILKENLYLRGGDVVYVPAINLNRPTVKVEGAVNDPGIYELSENETLTDFLLRVNALSRRTDLNYAYVERPQGNGEFETIPIFKYLNNGGNGHSDLILQNGDRINVPQRLEDVYVIGAVHKPGPYPYIPGFKAQDYVGLAGSTYQAKNIASTKVIDADSNKQKKGKDLLVEAGDTVFVPTRNDFGYREIISAIGATTNILIAIRALSK